MFNTSGNQWFVPDVGMFNIPKHIKRRNGAWGIAIGVEMWWLWRDSDHGQNHLNSLNAAAAFATTIGSLEVEDARAYIDLCKKGRLTPTGVHGVFYRSGLKQGYHAIIDGDVVEFPYADGRGFCKAAAAVTTMMSEETKRFIDKVGPVVSFHLP